LEGLADYYRSNVIGGFVAALMAAENADSFSSALAKKT
jgi:hypothetical protein